MPIRVTREDKSVALHLEGILLPRDAAELKHAMRTLLREANTTETIPIYVAKLLFLNDEVKNVLIAEGKDLIKGGDSIKVMRFSQEIRDYLIFHGVLPALPSDEIASPPDPDLLKKEFTLGEGFEVAVGDKNEAEQERLVGFFMRRQFKIIALAQEKNLLETAKAAHGCILSYEFKNALDTLKRLKQEQKRQVMGVMLKEDAAQARIAELVGVPVAVRPCPEDILAAFAHGIIGKSETTATPPAVAAPPPAAPAPAEPEAATAPPARAKILIVDDSNLFRKQVIKMLGDGFETQEAPSGEAALDLLAGMPVKPAVILLDIIMKEVDGIATLRRLRTDPALAAIPVIMLTGTLAREKVLEAMKSGAQDFLAKPITAEVLRARIRKLVDKPG